MSDRLNEPIVCDELELEVPVRVGGKEYVLREASGAAASRFINMRTATYKHNSAGQLVGFQNVGDLAPSLVSWCLFDMGGRPVKKADIEKWPNRIQEKLFNRALDISNLRDVHRPTSKQLQEALGQEGSPISFEDFAAFIGTLDTSEFKDLRAYVRSGLEQQAKNSEDDTTDGSS